MISVQDILKSIDTSKAVKGGWELCIFDMCESEFEIYDYVSQPENEERLTYCYYHRWICTDTEVGIRVWYFDDRPVCISWQSSRKSDEEFAWLSEEDFKEVKNYCLSLLEPKKILFDVADDKVINKVVEKFNSIDYKQFEEKYIKQN